MVGGGAVAAALALAMVLAGCLGLPGSGGGHGDAGDARDDGDPYATLDLRGCREHQAVFLVPASTFRDRLPDGFEPYLVDEPTDTSMWSLFTVECASTIDPSGDTGPSRDLMAIHAVEPPAHLRSEEARYHVLVLSVVASAATAPAYRAWSFPNVEEEDVTFTELADGVVYLGESSGGGAAFMTDVVGTPEDWQGRVLRIFGLDAGLDAGARPNVVDVVDVTVHDRRVVSEGEARYQLAADHPLAQVVPQQGVGLGEHWVMEPGAVSYAYRHVGLGK